jgi:hypothetical protein
MIRRLALLIALIALLAAPAAARAEFGLVPDSTMATAENRDGTIDLQAGSHPFSYTVHMELNTDTEGFTEGGTLRDLLVEAPPGLVGNPQAVSACPRTDFEGSQPKCAPGTQIGVARAIIPGFPEAIGPLYNLEAPPGSAAQLGFSGGSGLITLPMASVRGEATALNDEPFGVNLLSTNLPVPVASLTATVWGVPADPGHTPERGPNSTEGGVASEAQLLPFLTLPTSCQVPPKLTVRVASKENPGVFAEPGIALTREKAGNPVTLTGCEVVPFSPQIASGPSSGPVAGQAAGLGFQLSQPNKGLLNPKDNAVTETQAKRTELVLPAGMTANPAAAGGLGACSPQQFKQTSCPENSKLGSLVVHTPLLEEAVEGSLYLATPHDNPFGSLVAIYIVATAPQRGVTVKVAGRVEIDPVTGQLTTIVDGLPPVPYSSFEVRLREGPRAPLISPRTCGTYTATMRLYPYSDPDTATVRTSPFTITTGAAGGPCAPTEAQLPNNPTIEGGTVVPLAGAYSPLLLKVSRSDADQRLSSLEVTVPEGLTGKLKGVPYCPESGIAQAIARSYEGGGAAELAVPSCPAASQVGTVNAGAGAGSQPYYVQGKAYLAGPYKGAPLSLAIITPAVAGPFDLGVVVVRAGLYVNEMTGQITTRSDPLPTILQGIPLDVRSVTVSVDRSSFTLNPTSCELKQISGTWTSTTGATAPLRQRFQVGGCKGLPFSPKLQMSLSGATTRAKHPAFKAVLTQPQGQANLKKLSLTLPPTEFVDPNHVANPCTRPQFAAGACPSSSVLGKVRAFTPLLDKPLEGKIYFRANGGERELPDAVADLNGQVHLISVGFVDAVVRKGTEESRIRTTIATVPDAPISKVIIELKGGKKHGLLVNSANICKSANRALVKMWGQNGKVQSSEPRIAVECGGKRRK